MFRIDRSFALFVAAMFAVVGSSQALMAQDELKTVQDKDGVEVQHNGKLVLKYRTRNGAKPIIWPIVGPTGKEMSRAFPMREDRQGEKRDHIHQRSLWFTHGDVNGVSFWHEQDNHGDIMHKEFVEISDGPKAVIATKNDWVAGGETLCKDERRIVVSRTADRLVIDFDLKLIAGEKEVKLGDTKEGCLGIRIPTSMDVNSKQGGKIVNSEGQTDGEAWGKRAKWVDYHGPVEGDHVGVAILNHPGSFRHPTYWHVRDYGLFAANPLGVKDFTQNEANNGSHTLKPGESIDFRHRFIFHKGDEKVGGIAEAWEEYAKTP